MNSFLKAIINSLQIWTKKEIRSNQSDWNQNDPNKPGYVKNRTHWVENTGIVRIIPEITVDIEEDEWGYYVVMLNDYCYPNPIPPLIADQTYTVTFDGVAYQCVAREIAEWGCILLGNGTVGYEGDGAPSNNEPFLVWSYDDGNAYLEVGSEGTHTISIEGPTCIIHKLDSKYIDDSIIEEINFISNHVNSNKDEINTLFQSMQRFYDATSTFGSSYWITYDCLLTPVSKTELQVGEETEIKEANGNHVSLKSYLFRSDKPLGLELNICFGYSLNDTNYVSTVVLKKVKENMLEGGTWVTNENMSAPRYFHIIVTKDKEEDPLQLKMIRYF